MQSKQYDASAGMLLYNKVRDVDLDEAKTSFLVRLNKNQKGYSSYILSTYLCF